MLQHQETIFDIAMDIAEWSRMQMIGQSVSDYQSSDQEGSALRDQITLRETSPKESA
jgi:hypothetical protein